MHDHSLGGPYGIGKQPGALHAGECFDGVYGCHFCWNAANDGNGTVEACDGCGAETYTRVTRAWDENASHAWCEECRQRNTAEAERAQQQLDREAEARDEEPEGFYDDEDVAWEPSPGPVRDPLEGAVDVEVTLTDDDLKY
jgi:transcription elongation factor Elf1